MDTIRGWSSGVALGFYSNKLIEDNELPDFSFPNGSKKLLKVCYSNKEQEALVERILKYDISTSHRDGFITPSCLAGLSLAMKKEGFCEENEWRVIYTHVFNESNTINNECFFRNTQRGISPYFKLDFSTDTLAQIVIGPDNKSTTEDITLLLKHNNIKRIPIERSKTTYRN